MIMNYHGEPKKDPRLKIYINRDAERCLHDLARVWRRRDGTEMRYTDIVQLALFNLAAQSDIDVLPYLSLIGNALKEVDNNFKDLSMLKSQYAEQILADPSLQDLCNALENAQDVLGACEDEMRRQVLAGQLGAYEMCSVDPDLIEE